MTGLLYKELKNYLVLFIVIIICTVFLLLYIPLYIAFGKNYPDMIAGGSSTPLILLITVFICSGYIQGMIFRLDCRKAWAMWVASTPDGIKGYLRIKYEIVFALILTTLWSAQICDWIMTMVCSANNIEWESMTSAMIMLLYIQIIMRAAELPLTIRFGTKNGSIIKSIFLTLIAGIAITAFLLCGESIVSAFMELNTERLGTGLSILFSLFTVIALLLYYLSYRLSLRLFMKGVEQYDK